MRTSDETYVYQQFSSVSNTAQRLAARYLQVRLPMLSSSDVAIVFGTGPRTIRNWATSGRLNPKRVGKLWRFGPIDILCLFADEIRYQEAKRLESCVDRDGDAATSHPARTTRNRASRGSRRTGQPHSPRTACSDIRRRSERRHVN
jgi:hypothetical protein